MKWSNEPVLLSAIIAGLLANIGGAMVAIGEGVDPLVAVGIAVAEFGIIVGGGAVARSKAYGPSTAEDIMEADTFLSDRGI